MAIEGNELLGQVLGTCTLQSLIGRGGMGAVYLAQQSRPRRAVAVKVLAPGLLWDSKIRDEFLARFRREADAIAALDHVNIMPVYEYGEQEQVAYLVMPYVTGGTLRERLERRGILPLNEVLPIIEQAAAALDYAHQKGIVHRDLKPGNILFHADGRVLLADFGLAKVLKETTDADATLTSLGTVIGTPEYLSPEQATGSLLDQRSDIYSLGVILYQMLGGRVPFTGATPVAIAIKHTMEEPPPITDKNPSLPHAVVAVVMKAMAKKPEQRYASAGELAQALRAAIPEHLRDKSSSGTPLVLESTTPESSPASNDTVLDLQVLADIGTQPTLKDLLPAQEEEITEPTESVKKPVTIRKSSSSSRRLHLERQKGLPTWMLLLAGLLVFAIVIGGLALNIRPESGATSGTASTPRSTAVVRRTATPVSQQLPAPVIHVGHLLYGTNLPGGCDPTRAQWSNSLVKVKCSGSATEVKDSSAQFLGGTFLDALPDNYGIPTNYVLQVQVSQGVGSKGKFGVFFRNQPGNNEGAFSFLLDPSSKTWSAYSYNNQTGVATPFATGPVTVSLKGLLTIDVVVNGTTFTFYVNGQNQGYAVSDAYPSGTLGLASDVGADVFFKNLAIYTLPG
ncbi:MAG TPA: protein kinase [Ktedonobacteraceae bacterium]|nr:protein kinase [Ktedonobacteraceae bacterium]